MSDFRCITPEDAEWPNRLTEIAQRPPKQLFVRGLPLECPNKTIAVVGTRRPTLAGLEIARSLTRGLAESGFTIVSGLAIGIDTEAHRTALDSNAYTVAVLGCGLDKCFPARNSRLQAIIARQGTVVTEYPCGVTSQSYHFPARNRIVAGISRAVLVIEGGLRSGALITARLALDSNRSVFAVPGSTRNAMADGPNHLIKRSNAALVTEVKDIFDEVAPNEVWIEPVALGVAREVVELPPDEDAILHLLDDVPASLDHFAEESSLQPGAAAYAISKLEVRGWARRIRGGYAITEAGARARRDHIRAAARPEISGVQPSLDLSGGGLDNP